MDYQRATLDRFSRIHMVDLDYPVSPTGELVFATMTGDYIQGDGERPYNNVYVFRFAIADANIQRVDEYANPVTFANVAGLPIGWPRLTFVVSSHGEDRADVDVDVG